MHPVLIATAGAAANKDNNRREKGTDQRSDDAPHGSAVRGLVAAYIINSVMNNAESREIAGQRNDGNNKGEAAEAGGDQGREHAGAKGSEEEGDK